MGKTIFRLIKWPSLGGFLLITAFIDFSNGLHSRLEALSE